MRLEPLRPMASMRGPHPMLLTSPVRAAACVVVEHGGFGRCQGLRDPPIGAAIAMRVMFPPGQGSAVTAPSGARTL